MLYLVVATEKGIKVDEVDVKSETPKQYKIEGTRVERKLIRKAELGEPMVYQYTKEGIEVPLPFIFCLEDGIDECKQKVQELLVEELNKAEGVYTFYKEIN